MEVPRGRLPTAGWLHHAIATIVVDPTNPANLYAGTTGGIFKSTDAGASWTGQDPNNARQLAIDPTNPAILYAGIYGGVAKSTDAGRTWSKVNTGLATPDVYSLILDPRAPSTLYVGTFGGGVFKSTDGAATWAPANAGITGGYVGALSLDPTNPSTLYVSANGLYKSTNGALTWTARPVPVEVNVLSLVTHPANPSTVYAGSRYDGVFKSTDGGGTWVHANAGFPGLPLSAGPIAIDPVTPSTLYAVTSTGGVYKSTDSGGLWTPAEVGLPRGVAGFAIDPHDALHPLRRDRDRGLQVDGRGRFLVPDRHRDPRPVPASSPPWPSIPPSPQRSMSAPGAPASTSPRTRASRGPPPMWGCPSRP